MVLTTVNTGLILRSEATSGDIDITIVRFSDRRVVSLDTEIENVGSVMGVGSDGKSGDHFDHLMFIEGQQGHMADVLCYALLHFAGRN